MIGCHSHLPTVPLGDLIKFDKCSVVRREGTTRCERTLTLRPLDPVGVCKGMDVVENFVVRRVTECGH